MSSESQWPFHADMQAAVIRARPNPLPNPDGALTDRYADHKQSTRKCRFGSRGANFQSSKLLRRSCPENARITNPVAESKEIVTFGLPQEFYYLEDEAKHMLEPLNVGGAQVQPVISRRVRRVRAGRREGVSVK